MKPTKKELVIRQLNQLAKEYKNKLISKETYEAKKNNLKIELELVSRTI